MIKTLSHSNKNAAKFHRIPPPKRASTQERNWQALLEHTARDTEIDDAIEFDDELARLIVDCAQRVMAQ